MTLFFLLTLASAPTPSANSCRSGLWIVQLATVCERLHRNDGAEILVSPYIGFGRVRADGARVATAWNPQDPEWSAYARALGEPREAGRLVRVFDQFLVGGPGFACEVSAVRASDAQPPKVVTLTARVGSGKRPPPAPGCENWSVLAELENECRQVQRHSPPGGSAGEIYRPEYRRVFLEEDAALAPADLEPAFGLGRPVGAGRWQYTRSPATFIDGGRCDAMAEVVDGVVRSVELVASATRGQHLYPEPSDPGEVERLRAMVQARPKTAEALASYGIRGSVSAYGGKLRIDLLGSWPRMSTLVAAFGRPKIREAEPEGWKTPEWEVMPMPFAHFGFDGCHISVMVDGDLLGRMTDQALRPEVECPFEDIPGGEHSSP